MSKNQLTRANPDGTNFGQSTSDLISCYGSTPIAQRSGATQAAVTTTAISPVSTTAISPVSTTAISSVATTVALSSSPFGFSTAAQADAIVAAVNYLVTRSAADMTAINAAITQSAANMTAVGLVITRQELIRVLACELRLSLVPTTGIGVIAGA